jgi:hypothetical protein
VLLTILLQLMDPTPFPESSEETEIAKHWRLDPQAASDEARRWAIEYGMNSTINAPNVDVLSGLINSAYGKIVSLYET